jgi:hypothetical protein
MKTNALLAALAVLWTTAIACAQTPVIVMVGESTTWGQREDQATGQSPTNAAAVLEFLLSKRPDCQYSGLPVRNWALSATGTEQWFEVRPSAWCVLTPRGQNPLLDYACDHDLPLADALIPVLAARGEELRAFLVNAQGTNDANDGRGKPLKTAKRIAGWPTKLPAGVPYWIAPPFPRSDAKDSAIPTLSGQPPSRLRAYVKRVQRHELALGILTGPDWFVVMPAPPFQTDGFHLTDGGYAAAATWWLDVLCPS